MKDLVGLLNQLIRNTLTFQPLSGSSYIKLPVELRNSKTGLINIKNDAQKCFFWCHIRHLNASKLHPEKITQNDENCLIHFDYGEIEFSVSTKDFNKVQVKNKIFINVFYQCLSCLHIK